MRTVLLVVSLFCWRRAAATATPTPELPSQAAQIDLTIDPRPARRRRCHPDRDRHAATISRWRARGRRARRHESRRDASRDRRRRPDRRQGKVDIPFKWSMGGDWIVTVTVTLADDSEVSQDFNVSVKP